MINFVFHYKQYKSKIFSFITLVFIGLLMCGHIYVGNGDTSDFRGYAIQYYGINIDSARDFGFYYLFYATQMVGNFLSLTYYQWWGIMTALSLIAIARACKHFDYNVHSFLVYFMVYYIFVFYPGLKFYYGFCSFFYAISFLCRNQKYDKEKFLIFLLIAGGMHVLYYAFIIFLLVDLRILSPKKIFIITFFTVVVILLIGKNVFINSIIPIIGQIINSFDSENLNNYLSFRTNFGFVIPIVLHLFCLFYMRQCLAFMTPNSYSMIYRLYEIILLCTLFYPLYLLALTFMRFLTAMTLLMLVASSKCLIGVDGHGKINIMLSSIPLLSGYVVYNIFLNDYLSKTVIPMFDNYFFNIL